MKKLLLLTLLMSRMALAQTGDSTKVLSMADFFDYILLHHPVVKQAELLTPKAQMEIRTVRGAFDPSIYSTFESKEFKSTEYYSLWDNYLKVPTWYGIDFKAGYERNTGYYVSGEHQTPPEGLSYLGLSVPLGQGLLIDERRAQLRQAQQLSFIAEADRVKVINKLLLQAAKDYWDWAYCYQKQKLYEQSQETALERYNGIYTRVREGDMAAIDTVEAWIQVQNLQILLKQAEVDYQNASLALSNYLWKDEVPVEITSSIVPSDTGSEISLLEKVEIEKLVAQAQENHPDLIKLQAKRQQVFIEKRFAADKLKPKLMLDYYLLQGDFPLASESFNSPYIGNNHKLGLSFSYPLLLRRERGKLNVTKLKLKEIDFETQQTNREIINNIKASANEWLAFEQQLIWQEQLVAHAQTLRSGEQLRFDNGESSVFLINSREMSLISQQLKLYELKSKYAKSKIALRWAAGSVL